jgi:hypothetical protein
MAKYRIGQQFTTRGSPRLYTVVDILRTYNEAGDLVRTRYLAEYEFMGQTVTEEVLGVTIAVGLVERAA